MATFHAIQRAEERVKLKRKSAERLITNALQYGRTSSDFIGKEFNYLHRKETVGEARILVHSQCCFVVNNNSCITMFPVPSWFGKRRNNAKRSIVSGNCFTRFWNQYGESLIECEIA